MVRVTIVRMSQDAQTLEFNEPAYVRDAFARLGVDPANYTKSIKGRSVGLDTQLIDGDTLVLGVNKLSAAFDYIMVSFVSSGTGGYALEPIKVPVSPADDGVLTIRDVYNMKKTEIDSSYFRQASADNFKISMNGVNATFDTRIRANYAGEVFVVFSKPMSAAK